MRGKGSGGGGGGGGGGGRYRLLPNSLRIISSCLKTVSSNAGSVASGVRSAGASVAASIAATSTVDDKDQVLWAGFDKLYLSSTTFKHVLLLGYSNGFQVLDVEDATDVHELVSKRDGPVTFLQMQPLPSKSEGPEGFRSSHPILLIVASDETNGSDVVQGFHLNASAKDGCNESLRGICVPTPTVVRFLSLRTNNIVHILRFRSAVYIVRCSPRVVAVALASQIFCFDAVTLENKFSVLTYPIQGAVGVNVGYGPMALDSRWLAYASNNPLLSNSCHLSAQNVIPSQGFSAPTSPSNGTLVARYAMESSKQIATGILNLGDMGYKTLSKYYQDIRSDGTSSYPGRRILNKSASASHHSEADNSGMVVIKDFVSKDVISQFRAHTSPISALSFDPTGTLLVTASVHGNNINIFRIMPKPIANGSSSERYDWTSSHVHLYKLHRGLTTAVIQDISFSNYSEWVSIVSSRGTCHIFLLSPFGGDACLETQILPGGGPILVPSLSLPWWSTSTSSNVHFASPPAPVTLSVVSRIRNGNCGWLNSVSSVAASATGKPPACGAVASVFHNSVCSDPQKLNPKAHPLEKLLVHSPSGYVIQYLLLPSGVFFGSGSSMNSSPFSQAQDEELRVIAEPIQWWDVCRRANWSERDECISDAVLHAHDSISTSVHTFHSGVKCSKYLTSPISRDCGKKLVKTQYLSNAEVRGSYGHIPISPKLKICFYTMNPTKNDWISDVASGGEVEIENFPFHEVELRQKDPIPVFQQFHSIIPDWRVRDFAGGRYPTAESPRTKHKEEKPEENSAQLSSTSNCSTGQCVLTQNTSMQFPSVDEALGGTREIPIPASSKLQQDSGSRGQDIETFASKVHNGNCIVDDCTVCTVDSCSSGSLFSSDSRHQSHSHNDIGSDNSTLSDPNTHFSQSLDSPHYLHEGNCKLSELDDCREIEAVRDVDSNSSDTEETQKLEEDGDNDNCWEVSFSEEG